MQSAISLSFVDSSSNTERGLHEENYPSGVFATRKTCIIFYCILIFSLIFSSNEANAAVVARYELINNNNFGVDGMDLTFAQAMIPGALAGHSILPPPLANVPWNKVNNQDWGFGLPNVNGQVFKWRLKPILIAGGELLVDIKVPLGFNPQNNLIIGGNWFNGIFDRGAIQIPGAFFWFSQRDAGTVDVYVRNTMNSPLYYQGLMGFQSVPIEFNQPLQFWEERYRGTAAPLLTSDSGVIGANQDLLVASLPTPSASEYFTFGIAAGSSSDFSDQLFHAMSYSVPEPSSMAIFTLSTFGFVFRSRRKRTYQCGDSDNET